jgi:hypothetical protein
LIGAAFLRRKPGAAIPVLHRKKRRFEQAETGAAQHHIWVAVAAAAHAASNALLTLRQSAIRLQTKCNVTPIIMSSGNGESDTSHTSRNPAQRRDAVRASRHREASGSRNIIEAGQNRTYKSVLVELRPGNLTQ